MLQPKYFIDTLSEYGIEFFVGVPDSLLKNICAYISDNIDKKHNIIAANEGGAIGIAAGYHLATNNIPVVYMQNSGEGNVINPLASLTDKEVYNIPILLLIGWRGKPGVHDEPQHVKQGKITLSLLDVMGIKYSILSKNSLEATEQIANAVQYMKETNEVFALIVEKDTFEDYKLQKHDNRQTYTLSREEAIQAVVQYVDKEDIVVSTTGMISRELFEWREKNNQSHRQDFLTVGSMGHASQIALGISIEKPNRCVYCFDGDGAVIMHMGSMAIIGQVQPTNYVHIIFNNGAHDSVGGQPTVGLNIDMPQIAKSVGYRYVYNVDNKEKICSVLKEISNLQGPIFVQICVKKGNRQDLGRPTTTPIENKKVLMTFLQKNN